MVGRQFLFWGVVNDNEPVNYDIWKKEKCGRGVARATLLDSNERQFWSLGLFSGYDERCPAQIWCLHLPSWLQGSSCRTRGESFNEAGEWFVIFSFMPDLFINIIPMAAYNRTKQARNSDQWQRLWSCCSVAPPLPVTRQMNVRAMFFSWFGNRG